jgi:hypothetical protein
MATPREIKQLSVLMTRLGDASREALIKYIATGVLPENIGQDAVARAGVVIIDRITRNAINAIKLQFGGAVEMTGAARLASDIKTNWIRRCREVPSILLDMTNQIYTPSLAEGWADARIGRRNLKAFKGLNPRELANEVLTDAVKERLGRPEIAQRLRDKIEAAVEGKMPLNINVPGSVTTEDAVRFYDPADYAELVAQTTTAEMAQVGYLDAAESIGTTLVKMPFFNKPYEKLKDHVCARINGKIFSTRPEGSFGASGTFYPYLYSDEGIGDTGYPTPHPRCNHIARPIPEAAA